MAPLCALGRCCPRSDGQAVRAPRHGAYRLRHDPVLLALRKSVRHLRQHFRHRRHALDAERGRDNRRPIGRDPVGEAPERNARREPRTASPVRSAARSTAKPIPEQRPPWVRLWSKILSHGGAPSSTPRSLVANRPGRRARNGTSPTTSPRTSLSRRCRSRSWAAGSIGSPTRIAIRLSTSPT